MPDERETFFTVITTVVSEHTAGKLAKRRRSSNARTAEKKRKKIAAEPAIMTRPRSSFSARVGALTAQTSVYGKQICSHKELA